MMRTPLRTAVGAGLLTASLVFGLTACGQSPEAVSADLHSSVVQVAKRAAGGDYLGAIAALALLENDVDAAVDSGAIGDEQAADIREAIALVQADLEAARVADSVTPTPEPDPSEEDRDDNRGPGNNNGNKDKDKKNDKGDDD
ncbi:hypothetical protein ASD23_15285 [Agromyces sp. Root1464]|uniref:hypothetical protein n=1 Tax=Agromyces sp. Root1464 TaxID=1736467 RepID=UPI0006FA779E|nr:hypothetical protein [Agromyces sp. Root1464]KQZ09569.1 hypothetical protein ASD23_15285 [Agromyces sp. Root1464]